MNAPISSNIFTFSIFTVPLHFFLKEGPQVKEKKNHSSQPLNGGEQNACMPCVPFFSSGKVQLLKNKMKKAKEGNPLKGMECFE